MNQKFIEDNDIGIILNCTSTFQSIQLNGVQNKRLPFTDSFDSEKDIALLKKNKKNICDFIKGNLIKQNILICCFDGKTVKPCCFLRMYTPRMRAEFIISNAYWLNFLNSVALSYKSLLLPLNFSSKKASL